MTSWIFFGLYRFFLIPTAIFLLKIFRPFLGEKLKLMIEERNTPTWPEAQASPIWIHASSGEIEYAKPLIREIKNQWPQRPILMTYFSPSAKKLIERVEGLDLIVPLPWDHRQDMKRFIQHFHPEILFIARTDVWSECVYQAKQKDIPAILFSATLTENSSRIGFFTKYLTQFALDQLTEIHCVSEDDANQIRMLDVKTPIEVTGDTRYDQVLWRLENPHATRDIFKPTTHPILVAGSTWPQDEKELLPTLPKFTSQGGKVILAPHEVSESHITSLEKQLTELNLKFCRYSNSSDWSDKNVLILDQVGVLAEVYAWGDFAFVGGSFKDRVHSVMEPLAAGLPVLVGPHHSNNREALYFQNIVISKSQNDIIFGVQSVANSDEISDQLERLSKTLKRTPEMHKTLQNKIQSLTGATAKIVRKLSLLKKE